MLTWDEVEVTQMVVRDAGPTEEMRALADKDIDRSTKGDEKQVAHLISIMIRAFIRTKHSDQDIIAWAGRHMDEDILIKVIQVIRGTMC